MQSDFACETEAHPGGLDNPKSAPSPEPVPQEGEGEPQSRVVIWSAPLPCLCPHWTSRGRVGAVHSTANREPLQIQISESSSWLQHSGEQWNKSSILCLYTASRPRCNKNVCEKRVGNGLGSDRMKMNKRGKVEIRLSDSSGLKKVQGRSGCFP